MNLENINLLSQRVDGVLATVRNLRQEVANLKQALSGAKAELQDRNLVLDSLNAELTDCKAALTARAQVDALLKKTFRPEFLNRLDEIVFYKPLTKDNIFKIIDLQIAQLNKRLLEKQLRCTLTEAAKTYIVDAAFDPQFGARPLRRYVQHTVETMIAKRILQGNVQSGSELTVDVVNDSLLIL